MSNTRSLAPAVPTDAELHDDSRRWRSEAALWREELDAWHAAHGRALADLARIEAMLHEYAVGEALEQAELAAYGQQLRGHERAVADFIQGNDEPQRDEIRGQHQVLAALREEHRARHERSRQAILTLVAQIDAVRKAAGL